MPYKPKNPVSLETGFFKRPEALAELAKQRRRTEPLGEHGVPINQKTPFR